MICETCGVRMARFLNPERYLCPKESTHESGQVKEQRNKVGDDAHRTARRFPRKKDK